MHAMNLKHLSTEELEDLLHEATNALNSQEFFVLSAKSNGQRVAAEARVLSAQQRLDRLSNEMLRRLKAE